jgi:hypothetical protein
VVTLIIAAYGAILSTIVLIQSVRKERRCINVEISPTFYRYADGQLSTQMASIDVINRGHRTVSVGPPCIRMPNGKFLVFPGVRGFATFPKRLEDGEKAWLSVKYSEISDALKKNGYKGKVTMRPACRDGDRHAVSGQEVETRYRSRLEPLDVMRLALKADDLASDSRPRRRRRAFKWTTGPARFPSSAAAIRPPSELHEVRNTCQLATDAAQRASAKAISSYLFAKIAASAGCPCAASWSS